MIEYNDESIMPWGMHKGKKLKDVPRSYWPIIVDKFKWGTMKPMGRESVALRDYVFRNNLHIPE